MDCVRLEQALELAREQDPRGFDALFRSLGPSVVGYLKARSCSDPDGVANDVFVRVFKKLHKFEGDGEKFKSWLFTIAHNASIDDARKRRRRVAESALDHAPEPATAADDVADAVGARLGDDRVKAMVGGLSADQRDVLLLRIVADLSIAETARIIGKNDEAVKALQRRGLAALRRSISPQEPVPD